MELPKKFLHDRLVLLLITLIATLVVIGVGIVMLRFDASKNPTTVVAYLPNVSGSSYQSGKPIDIYLLAVFMMFSSTAAIFLSAKTYLIRRFVSVFILSSTVFLLILSAIVANSLISLQ